MILGDYVNVAVDSDVFGISIYFELRDYALGRGEPDGKLLRAWSRREAQPTLNVGCLE